MSMDDLDNVMDVLDSMAERESGRSEVKGKNQIGSVEQFFDRLGVVAITLTGELSVGDIIEIGDEEEAVRQKVTSMQIDREDVQSASEGASVGIKLNHKVAVGSYVYKIR